MKTRSKVLSTSVEVGSEVEHYSSNERADFEDEPYLSNLGMSCGFNRGQIRTVP